MTIDLRKPQGTGQNEVRVSPARERDSIGQTYRPRSAPKRKAERAVMLVAAGAGAIVVLILVVYGATKVWGYFFASEEAQVRALVADVGEHMLLPENETPNIATVSDLHALEGQLFFKNAEVGDQVLMYLISQKAIIYRPSIDKIIEVGPITGSEQ